ncbi:hypothetical protein [Sorangium sp. So ce1153]|uniref:hypothetical protein n=1 Tax=Sorangium sp. So ce1153 TaxID=3133333 RepID=UPI003F6333E1
MARDPSPRWRGHGPASRSLGQPVAEALWCSELVEAWDQAYGTRRFEYDPASQILANVPEHERAELFRYDACGNVFDVAAGHARP